MANQGVQSYLLDSANITFAFQNLLILDSVAFRQEQGRRRCSFMNCDERNPSLAAEAHLIVGDRNCAERFSLTSEWILHNA